MLVGAGILWTGWNGFNGGDPYAASADAGAAVLNTNICTAMSVLTWTMWDVIMFKKPAVIGAVQGMITGLVAITPAAGVVAGWGAIIIGFLSGSIPWVSMNILGKTKYFAMVDDTLGVFHTHAVAGFVGGMCAGIFAEARGTAAFGLTSGGGGIQGNGKQVWLQLVGALFIIALNIVMTSIIMNVIKLIVPLRMTEEQLLIGDDAIHGEEAYEFGYPPQHVTVGSLRHSLVHGDTERKSTDPEMGHGGVIHGTDPVAAGSGSGSNGESSDGKNPKLD